MFHRQLPFIVIAISAFLFASAPISRADNRRILHIRADSWMPFNGDPRGEKPGYVVELLREVFEPQGIQIDYQTMPWAKALKAAEAGEIDGVIGANRKEAINLFVGEESVAQPKFALFIHRGSPWKYESLRSLQGTKLGAIESYDYWDSIDLYIKKSSPPAVKLYSGDAPLVEALGDLESGKIDVLPESVLVFYWTVKSTGRSCASFQIAYSENSDPLYVAFSPSREGRKYAQLFDLGLRSLKENGRFDAIAKKYGIEKQ